MNIFKLISIYYNRIYTEKKFILIFTVLNFFIFFLNRNSQMMGGLLDYYFDFKNIISHGFDSNYGKMNCPTFPMWGYGWIFLFTTNKFILFFIQFIFSLFTLLDAIYFLEKFEKFSKSKIHFFKLLLLLSFSFVSINYTLSPYSIAINLQILSVIYLIRSSKTNLVKLKFFYVVISAVFYGILLNFRSDYLYFTLIVPLIYIYLNTTRLNVIVSSVWISITFLFLIPWLIYTNHVVGKPLFSSTNSGHVFFIGLGNLPNNKWHISTSDQDSVMYYQLRNNFGRNTSSLRFEEDVYLKNMFVDFIKKDPFEYSKKVIYSGFKTVVSGIYVPEYFNILNDCSSLGCKQDFVNSLVGNPFDSLFESPNKFFIYTLSYFSILFGIIVIFISHLSLPFYFFSAFKEKNLFNLLSSLLISYQFLINSFAFQMKLYSTYSYFWSLFIIIFLFRKRFNPAKL